METITQDKLYQLAFQAGLKGDGPKVRPNSYGGYKIPEMFEDGALGYGIWHQGYSRGLEAAEEQEAIEKGHAI